MVVLFSSTFQMKCQTSLTLRCKDGVSHEFMNFTNHIYENTKLARLVSDMPVRQFNEHVQKLEQIVDFLKARKEYKAQDIHPDEFPADTITKALNPIAEIFQDNEVGDDSRGSIYIGDIASSPSQAEPHLTAEEVSTRIQKTSCAKLAPHQQLRGLNIPR
ncbi:unnamed protein product [Mytilus coruscus]|uniref:Uncharacterized protein n=1 Tax=Mytilus coruscus TaxID=42192 RepID=A0A6J8C4Z8_MYTCO|nr:unnamed protein product [Mytilus coruscus]